ncbi:MAG: hypothetical protein V7661_06165 [Sulfitobacter sp.]
MLQSDRWHIFSKAIAELADDADVARRMVIGLLSVGIALIIAASFNEKEVPFFIRAAAEVPIAISIWVFWTASNRFKGQSKSHEPRSIFPNSFRGIIAGMQIFGAAATGLLIWHL